MAIVGAGRMGQQHARSILELRRTARLVGIVDSSETARRAAHDAFPGTPVLDSLDSLTAALGPDRRPDVVHVCTPPHDHVSSALAALAAGCHLYVEKPVALSHAETERILASAAARGLAVAAGHQLLFARPVLQARDLLPAVGDIVHAESYFSFRTVRRSPDGRTPLRSDLQLLDVLPHPIYLLVDALLRARPDSVPTVTSVEIGPAGTVHAFVRSSGVTGVLTVTLEGRPIENSLRIVGSNGEIFVDLVRGTLRRHLGPGVSGIDKALNPYRAAWQTAVGTTAALARRAVSSRRGYPGLVDAIERFHHAIVAGEPSPTPAPGVLATMAIWDAIAGRLNRTDAAGVPVGINATASRNAYPNGSDNAGGRMERPLIAVTGGTGLLGRAVVMALRELGYGARVLARRLPAEWERVPGTDYLAVDLGAGCDDSALRGCIAVIHCAAATAGGFAEHEHHSVAAAENTYLAARNAGVPRFIHVSSMGALSVRRRARLDEGSPLESGRSRGAYVWGKAESERRLLALANENGPALHIVRPAAIIDPAAFDPPGRLGKRLGNLFIAPGSSSSLVGVVELGFAARFLAWMASTEEHVPRVVNLLQPEQPTRRDLVRALRQRNPDLRVIRVPSPLLESLSIGAVALQKLLRPRRPATSIARVFRSQAYDLATIRTLAPRVDSAGRTPPAPPVLDAPASSDAAPQELRAIPAGT
ncbi:MAG TPA: Gfo/Idh/MocA family oxidoreductase [Longimicrobiales bacterium]|nr:Gfo/Idh/MocA family oxidoreductase [Longimicrobiales bacterium]